jgi:hypothetical protein
MVDLVDPDEYALRPEYDGDLLDIYEKTVLEMSGHTGSRKYYKEIAANIGRMLKYDGGKERVAKLLEFIRETYPSRPALQDELRYLWQKMT